MYKCLHFTNRGSYCNQCTPLCWAPQNERLAVRKDVELWFNAPFHRAIGDPSSTLAWRSLSCPYSIQQGEKWNKWIRNGTKGTQKGKLTNATQINHCTKRSFSPSSRFHHQWRRSRHDYSFKKGLELLVYVVSDTELERFRSALHKRTMQHNEHLSEYISERLQ